MWKLATPMQGEGSARIRVGGFLRDAIIGWCLPLADRSVLIFRLRYSPGPHSIGAHRYNGPDKDLNPSIKTPITVLTDTLSAIGTKKNADKTGACNSISHTTPRT